MEQDEENHSRRRRRNRRSKNGRPLWLRTYRWTKHRIKNFNAHFTYNNGNIITIMATSTYTAMLTLLLIVVEPFFAKCFAYVEVYSLRTFIAIYALSVVIGCTILIFSLKYLSEFHVRIYVMWLNIAIGILAPLITFSLWACYPDIVIHRPIFHFRAYFTATDKNRCTRDIGNCYMNYFGHGLVIGLYFSYIVCGLHAFVYGRLAWNRWTKNEKRKLARRRRQGDNGDDPNEPLLK